MNSRLISVSLAALGALGCSACGAGSTTAPSSSSAPTTGAASQAPPSSSAPASTSATPTLSGAGGTTRGSGDAGSSPSTTKAAGGTTRTDGAAPSASLTAPAPGTYLYSQSGSESAGGRSQAVPAQGTMRIDPATQQAARTWTQTWHSYVDQTQPPNDTTYQFGSAGVAIASTTTTSSLNGQSVSFTCTFSPPLSVTPWPPTVGYAFSGQGSCGSFTAQVSGRIDGTRAVDLDGQSITTYVIDATITTHGSVSLTDRQTDWFSPSLRLLVHTSDDEQGTYGLFSFSSQITRDLESAHPR